MKVIVPIMIDIYTIKMFIRHLLRNLTIMSNAVQTNLVLVKKEVVIFTRAPYLGLILTV